MSKPTPRTRARLARKAPTPNTQHLNAATKKLTKLLKQYAELERQAEAAKIGMKDLAAEIEACMKDNACKEFHTRYADADMVKPRSNPRRTVIPEKFKEKVSEKEFLASVSITIKAAEKVLAGKEIDAVVETQKAKLTKAALKITVKPVAK